jgi:hypothetical protein
MPDDDAGRVSQSIGDPDNVSCEMQDVVSFHLLRRITATIPTLIGNSDLKPC